MTTVEEADQVTTVKEADQVTTVKEADQVTPASKTTFRCGGRHSTAVAFKLRALAARVRFSAFPRLEILDVIEINRHQHCLVCGQCNKAL